MNVRFTPSDSWPLTLRDLPSGATFVHLFDARAEHEDVLWFARSTGYVETHTLDAAAYAVTVKR